jgi:hypothetical protein
LKNSPNSGTLGGGWAREGSCRVGSCCYSGGGEGRGGAGAEEAAEGLARGRPARPVREAARSQVYSGDDAAVVAHVPLDRPRVVQLDGCERAIAGRRRRRAGGRGRVGRRAELLPVAGSADVRGLRQQHHRGQRKARVSRQNRGALLSPPVPTALTAALSGALAAAPPSPRSRPHCRPQRPPLLPSSPCRPQRRPPNRLSRRAGRRPTAACLPGCAS